MQLIKEFCGYYNIIVNWSTIEGELITYENIDKFLEFMSTQSIHPEVITQHNNVKVIADKKEKAVLVLCEYIGKTETQEQKGGVRFNGNKLKTITSKKTSGWIDRWINYYFENHLNNLTTNTDKRIQFKKDFPHLYGTLQELENMVE